MEDLVLIVSVILSFGLGLIPIIKLNRFLRSRRTDTIETDGYSDKRRRLKKGGPAEDPESVGVLYFDPPCDPEQIDRTDLK